MSSSSSTSSYVVVKQENEDTSQVPIVNMAPIPAYKRRRNEKPGKGLRHFAMRVCEKVRSKMVTTYNEVADELVAEYPEGSNTEQYDQKNVRRRVYDALNVLMAMNIISKEKKEIKWIGLPVTSFQESSTLTRERDDIIARLNAKQAVLQDLIVQQVTFKQLVEKNKKYEHIHGRPSSASVLSLPFIAIKADTGTVIDCSISQDKKEYLFGFSNSYEIVEDMDLLKSMNLSLGLNTGTSTAEQLEKAKSCVPKKLHEFLSRMYNIVFYISTTYINGKFIRNSR
ncbi:Transcription factor DP, C-terminal,Winged helix-turn-helix DNA-binding domain,E2F/DP family, winged-helix [Cinara cedri]|uniref:Transcription factor DP, C-terminal,Winged helix-turn-helix DNA-binding domain,E2F/DP family, winged-helix n=1 Tax=Cinara cedri TaxID=506608 RepID=A0A5E4MK80_9HEMI|nr:Transcription factor DP, C-terminal,Winged helix-turn-helix DNA-binding domain,E2F/DP family, winged-helix [Cinara cedri]